jgi:hypothetical protein
MTKLIVVFHNFAKAPKIQVRIIWQNAVFLNVKAGGKRVNVTDSAGSI